MYGKILFFGCCLLMVGVQQLTHLLAAKTGPIITLK